MALNANVANVVITGNVNASGTLNGAVPGANVTGTVATAANASAVTCSSSRTDSTAYQVCWTNAAANSQLYSCAGVTIQSSTGTLAATVLNATSDANLKSDITRISDSTFILGALQGVRYNWKSTGLSSAGLIAQDVQKVLPEAVTESDKGTMSLNYNAIIAVLVEEVKALRAEVDILKALTK
jgi:hypothetical protein